MKNSRKYALLLLGFLYSISLISCQFGGKLDSNQTKETSQITETGSNPTPIQQTPASEEMDSNTTHGVRIELQDSDRWVQMLRLGKEWRFGLATLSPNGEWIVSNASQEPKEFEFLEIMPTMDENLEFAFQPKQELGLITPEYPTWSPDSANLAYWGMNKPQSYCYHSRLVILQIDPINLSVNPASFELPGDGSECATFTWSPDGSMLAVIPNSDVGEIYILDVTGQVLDQILIPMDKDSDSISFSLGDLAWTSTGLFYSIYTLIWNSGVTDELYQLDLHTHESFNKFRLGVWRLSGIDPTGASKFLLTRGLSQNDDPTLPYPRVDEYAILDVETQEMYKLELENSTCRVFSSTSKFTAFACDNPHELWIYNWEDESLNNYGEYGRVLGWSDKHQGYLLSAGNDENPRVEALQP